MPSRRTILIVEDDEKVLQDIAETLYLFDFDFVPPHTALSFDTPELFIMRRGQDQVHITAFGDMAIQAMVNNWYDAAFLDYGLRGKGRDPVYIHTDILDLLQNQPHCTVWMISDSDRQGEALDWAAQKHAPHIDIKALIQSERLRPFIKEGGSIVREIREFLESSGPAPAAGGNPEPR